MLSSSYHPNPAILQMLILEVCKFFFDIFFIYFCVFRLYEDNKSIEFWALIALSEEVGFDFHFNSIKSRG